MSHQRLETKLSLYIRRDDEIDVSGNDESASRGYLMLSSYPMLIRGPVSAGRKTPAVLDAIWMAGDDSALEPARRARLR
jgi:hypothetical protein